MTTLLRLFKMLAMQPGRLVAGWGSRLNQDGLNPLTHGFDHFSGWKSSGIAHTYYPTSIVRDGKEENLLRAHVHDLIMDDAFAFIRQEAESGTPFFCYIPTAIPHAAMHAPKTLHEKWRKNFQNLMKKSENIRLVLMKTVLM